MNPTNRSFFQHLEQHERSLAADMWQLRRDLRRDVSQVRIAMERDKIRRDWMNIVVDRSLGGVSFSPTLVCLSARSKRNAARSQAENGELARSLPSMSRGIVPSPLR